MLLGNMGSRPFDSLICHSMKTLALLVCAWWLADASVWASCGDYVTRKGAFAKKDHGPHTATLADSMPRNHSRPHDPAAPCSGPMCSKGKLPPLTPSPSSSQPSDDWVCAFGVATATLLQVGGNSLLESPHLPILRPTRIFHPPRPLSLHPL
jgi:hypothetical protein